MAELGQLFPDMLRGSSSRDHWGTPGWLFNALDREFRFDLDAAAEPRNAKCDRWLGPGGLWGDALSGRPWPGRRVWCNPPYTRATLVGFLERAAVESRRGATVVVLIPVRSEMDWWHDQVLAAAAELRFLRGRTRFVPPPEVTLRRAGNRPVFNSAVAIYLPGVTSLQVASFSTLQPDRRRAHG